MQEARQSTLKRVLWSVVGAMLVATLIAIEAIHLRGQITVGNLDFFGMAARAKALPGNLPAWVSGLYPVGIPLLLRAGLALGLDVVRSGQAASILGGIACLCGAALFAWHVTHSYALSLLTMAFLLTTRSILFYAGFEGTDMLAAGFQVLALGLLARNPRSGRVLLVAGIVNGLAYLARYTGMVFFAVCLAYLLTMALVRRERKALWSVAIYGLGFLIGALPQLVPSLIVKGNPFYQTQALHIWIKLYGNDDFVRTAGTAPTEITLWQLFWLDPRRLAANGWSEFSHFWMTFDVPLVGQPLAQLARAGFLFAALDARRLSVEHRTLLAFIVAGMTGALSIFTLNTRFLILLVPVFMWCAIYFVWRIVPSDFTLGRARLPINLIVLALLLGLLANKPWEFARTPEGGPHANTIETSNILHAAGARTAREILSTNLYHQDVASPTRDRFSMLYLAETPPTVDALRRVSLQAGYRFLIFTASDGMNYHPQYQDLLSPEKRPRGYTPIWIGPDDEFVAYRLEPDAPSPQIPFPAKLAEGISFLGYDVSVSDDQPAGAGQRVGVYLYWQATQPLTQSLKVFVHLLDAQGQVAAQHDGVPAQWTYNTRAWQPGEVIVDAHQIAVGANLLPREYTLQVGLYDEQTGARVNRVDDAGKSVDDKIVLSKIKIP
jgi:hypothetical protein